MTRRGRLDFSFAAFIAILLAWNAFQLSLFDKPQKWMLDVWISQQVGRTARNHLVLGLGRTKGANITGVKQDGTLIIHASYSPLASWTAAVPMALGVPFRASTKIVTIASMNLFFIAFWYVLRQHGNPWVASFGAAYAAMFPVTLLEYGQSCIFEILGLGPTFCAFALFSQPRRTPGIWLAIAMASILGVMYSWFDLMIVGPCILREVLVRGRREGLIIGALALVVPIAVHFTILVLASGSTEPIRSMFSHALERTGSVGDRSEVIRYTHVVYMVVTRWKELLGTLAFAATVLWLIHQLIEWRKTEVGFTTAVLLAYGLPLNLVMRNASNHEFFIIMFAPLAALALARVSWIFLGSTGARESRLLLGMALVFLCFLYSDVWIVRFHAHRGEFDTRMAAIGDEVARNIRLGDFVIAGPSFVENPYLPDGSRLPAESQSREFIRDFGYFGQMAQGAFLAYDAADAANVMKWARPDQQIIILLQKQKASADRAIQPKTLFVPMGWEVDDDIWDITQYGFRSIPTGIKDFVIGIHKARSS
jgi:hypothetical protein